MTTALKRRGAVCTLFPVGSLGCGHLRTCPYHAWVYDLDGRLHRARRSELIENFDPEGIFLTPVQLEVFCHWLAGDEARYASGQLWVLDGGLSAQVQQMRV
jgi:hypothetical protein